MADTNELSDNVGTVSFNDKQCNVEEGGMAHTNGLILFSIV